MQQAGWIEEQNLLVSVCRIKQIKGRKLTVHEVWELCLVTTSTAWPCVQPPQIPHQAVVGRLVDLALVVSSQFAMLLTIQHPVTEAVRTVVGR